MEKIQHDACPVTYCMGKIGGKWKPILLHLIRKGANRFGVLERGIDGITKQMLTKQLRELEADGILERKIYPVIPPKVEYFITPFGKTLLPIIDAMGLWGINQMESAESAIEWGVQFLGQRPWPMFDRLVKMDVLRHWKSLLGHLKLSIVPAKFRTR